MARRSLLYLVLALALSVAFAGCTDGSDGSSGSGPSETEEPDEGGDLGPLAEQVPGVSTLPLPDGTPAVLGGTVYDTATGSPIGGATVTATCVRQGLPPLPGPSVTSADDGRFAFDAAATATLAECTAMSYEVAAAGYTMAVPLHAGPVGPGVQQVIHAGMMPAN